MMTDQVYARALLMAGELDGRQQDFLRVLCEAACVCLESGLRDGVTPEDCAEAFVTAASLLALADLGGVGEAAEFKAGDLTVKMQERQEDGIQNLRRRADQLMAPFLKGRFSFQGV